MQRDTVKNFCLARGENEATRSVDSSHIENDKQKRDRDGRYVKQHRLTHRRYGDEGDQSQAHATACQGKDLFDAPTQEQGARCADPGQQDHQTPKSSKCTGDPGPMGKALRM